MSVHGRQRSPLLLPLPVETVTDGCGQSNFLGDAVCVEHVLRGDIAWHSSGHQPPLSACEATGRCTGHGRTMWRI